MRHLGHVDAPLVGVRKLFHDVEDWSSWMPDLAELRVLESEGDRRRAEVYQTNFGRSFRNTVEVRFHGDRIRVRTLDDGWFQWQMEWTFLEPPSGGGTTVSLELDFDMPLLGRASRRMFHRVNERRFAKILLAAAQRVRRTTRGEEPERARGRTLLAVYETADGFEVLYGGRRYVTRRKPP